MKALNIFQDIDRTHQKYKHTISYHFFTEPREAFIKTGGLKIVWDKRSYMLRIGLSNLDPHSKEFKKLYEKI